MLFYKHEQCMIPDNCTKYEQNHQIVLCDITTNTQNLWKHYHNYRAKFYFTCISSPWYLSMVPYMKKIQPAIMEECTRMDWQMDWWIGPFPKFPNSTLSRAGNNMTNHLSLQYTYMGHSKVELGNRNDYYTYTLIIHIH